MKLRKLLCLTIVFLAAATASAQDLKIHVDEKGKVGFADSQGNVVIKCQYESAQPFSEGVAIVTKSGKSGIIDATGNILLPLKYSQINSWSDELYLIKDGKKMGLCDHQGKVVLPVNYSNISKVNCYGKALIAEGGKSTQEPNAKKSYMNGAKYGIIDAKGNVLIPATHKGLYEFYWHGKDLKPYYEGEGLHYSYHFTTDTLVTDCSYLGFNKNGFNIDQAGLIDGTGKELVKMGLYNRIMQPKGGMVRYYIIKKKETLCGYHNIETGTSFQAQKFDTNFSEIQFWTHGDFIGDIAPVNGTSWSFIDKTGKQLRTGYTSLKHSLHTGVWAAQKGSEWEVFDDNNNDITALSGFGDIGFPMQEGDKEIYNVMKDGKFGAITRSGNIAIPFGKYETIWTNNFDVVVVKKDGKFGAVTPNDEELIPIEYAYVVFPIERNAKHFWVKKADSLYYHLNLDKNALATTGYKAATNFKNGVAHVAPKGLVVEDTPINRAQMFEPNTAKATIDAYDMSKATDAFGHIINTDDVVLMDIPVSMAYVDKVIEVIKAKGGRALTEQEKKDVLLEATKANRSYDIKSTIGEEEWNY